MPPVGKNPVTMGSFTGAEKPGNMHYRMELTLPVIDHMIPMLDSCLPDRNFKKKRNRLLLSGKIDLISFFYPKNVICLLREKAYALSEAVDRAFVKRNDALHNALLQNYIRNSSFCLNLIRACNEINGVWSLRLTAVMLRCNINFVIHLIIL
jgi:hypothetical protein